MADPVAPEGKLNLAAVSALHAQFKERSGRDVTIDLGKVTSFGALCLQVCLAAARDAKASGASFEIVNIPDNVTAQIESMGFTPETLAEGAA